MEGMDHTQLANYKAEYQDLNEFKLKGAFHQLNRTFEVSDTEYQYRMAALQQVMKEKGIRSPMATPEHFASRPEAAYAGSTETGGGVNPVRIILGLVIMCVGIGLTVSSDGYIFYGAILVGLFMMIGGAMKS